MFKHYSTVWTVVLLLCLLELGSLPFLFYYTYADPDEQPAYCLTYTDRHLVWNTAEQIQPNGAVALDFMGHGDIHVQQNITEHIIAPGTQKQSTVRLQNDTDKMITYTAVLYRMAQPELPVELDLNCQYADPTDSGNLPAHIEQDDVISAVAGTLHAYEKVNMDVIWRWLYEVSAVQNQKDTGLGDTAVQQVQHIQVGLYIVVEENGVAYSPEIPDIPGTGQSVGIILYTVLFVLTLFLVLLLCFESKEKHYANAKKD